MHFQPKRGEQADRFVDFREGGRRKVVVALQADAVDRGALRAEVVDELDRGGALVVVRVGGGLKGVMS